MKARPAFGRSAAVYRLIYARRPYAREAARLDRIVRKRLPRARALLELGCGPGLHAEALARRGWRVVGVDRSAAMLSQARPRPGVELARADVRRARLGRRFDAAAALFHVFSYLPAKRDLRAALEAAAAHLRAGGVLVFDCWHRGGVRASPPRRRVVEAEDRRLRVRRISRPSAARDGRRVDVRQSFEVLDKATGRRERFSELHRLRAWDVEELRAQLDAAGFAVEEVSEDLGGAPLRSGSFTACVVARKRAAARR